MFHTRTSRRYAKVLYTMAREAGRVDDVQADLAGLRELARRLPELSAFLTDYMIPSEQRIDLLKTLFEKRLDALTYRFLMFLEERHQMRMLDPMADFFGELRDQERGIVKAKITAARPLSAEQLDALRTNLEAKLQKRISAEAATDPTLLGGFTVRIGDVIYNSSTAHQLDTFKQKLITA